MKFDFPRWLANRFASGSSAGGDPKRKRQPSLEIHIPISPTPSFFNMVHYFAASLRESGGLVANARIIVSVGEDCEPFDIAAANPRLAKHGITWRWTDREAFRKLSFTATGLNRWRHPFEADFVLMADADLLVAGDLSDAIDQLPRPLGIAGVPANLPLWLATRARNQAEMPELQCELEMERWRSLFHLAELPEPVFDCPHPGFGVFYPEEGGMRASPAYFNYGFVVGTRDAMRAIAKTLPRDSQLAAQFTQSEFCNQAALTLSIIRNAIPYRALPVRYNFWTDHRYFSSFPEDAADAKILHYPYGTFCKARDMGSPERVQEWLNVSRSVNTEHNRFLVGIVEKAHGAVMADLASEARMAACG